MHPVALLPETQVLDACWEALQAGAASGRHPFHTCALATLGQYVSDEESLAWPEVRTVVLRDADPSATRLIIHTDARSPKAAEVQASGRVSVLFYDAPGKWQLRLRGNAELHRNTELAQARWAASRRESRECYFTPHPPGSPIAAGSPLVPGEEPVQPAVSDPLRETFAVIAIAVTELEALFLSADGHRRCRFRPAVQGTPPETLAP